MRPLLCNRYGPLEEAWNTFKLEYCVLQPHWKSNLILGIDCGISLFFMIASTIGSFGKLGEVMMWIGILNIWRVGITLFGIIFISSLWTDKEQIPLAQKPGELTQKIYVGLYLIGHLPLVLGISGIFGTVVTKAVTISVLLLLIAKVAHLFHPKEIDALDCIQYFIPTKLWK